MTTPPNYYDILGIEENTNETDIKKAYRTLSFQYHPDKNSSKEAENKMKDINEAYETLSDSKRRQEYDNKLKYGEQGLDSQMDGDLNDIINMMFGGGRGGPFGNPFGAGFPNGPNIRIFHQGGFHSMFSSPEPLMITVKISLLQAYQGTNTQIEIERNIINSHDRSMEKEKETIFINIPQGIQSNEILVMTNKGHRTIHPRGEEICGELRISFDIVNDTSFQRDNLDLIFTKKISLKESLCGFSFEIDHLNGKRFCINNNNNIIHTGYCKEIPNLGMIREGKKGKLLIQFDIIFPTSLTESQIDKLKEIW
jgi:DnaJ family protein B protein 4